VAVPPQDREKARRRGVGSKAQSPSRRTLESEMRASGVEVGAFLEKAFREGARTRACGGVAVRWMGYLISHESHHRCQMHWHLHRRVCGSPRMWHFGISGANGYGGSREEGERGYSFSRPPFAPTRTPRGRGKPALWVLPPRVGVFAKVAKSHYLSGTPEQFSSPPPVPSG
jgi:hypothetical protein